MVALNHNKDWMMINMTEALLIKKIITTIGKKIIDKFVAKLTDQIHEYNMNSQLKEYKKNLELVLHSKYNNEPYYDSVSEIILKNEDKIIRRCFSRNIIDTKTANNFIDELVESYDLPAPYERSRLTNILKNIMFATYITFNTPLDDNTRRMANIILNTRDEILDQIDSAKTDIKELLSSSTTKSDINILIDKMEALINSNEELRNAVRILSQNSQMHEDDIIRVYNALKKELFRGNLETVYNIIPLISGKNDSLENAIKIGLEILSNYKVINEDILSAHSKIANTFISDDVARLLVLFYLNCKEKLSILMSNLKNQQLKSIVKKLINDSAESFFVKTLDSNTNVYQIHIIDDFKNEIWLTKRIVVSVILKENYNNIDSIIETIIGDDKTFVDKLLIYEKKELVLLNKPIIDKETALFDELSNIAEELKKEEYIYLYASEKIQEQYYIVLLRALSILNVDEALKIMDNMSEYLFQNIKIKGIVLKCKIDNNQASETEIIKYCLKSDYFGLLPYYWKKSQSSQEHIMTVLNENKYLIDNDLYLYLTYVRAIKETKGDVDAKIIIAKYKDTYGKYLEYWVSLYYSSNNDEKVQLLDCIINKMDKDEVHPFFVITVLIFTAILLKNEKVQYANKVIESYETVLHNVGHSLDYIKSRINMQQGKEIEALDTLMNIFPYYKDNAYIVDLILLLSIKNRRQVKEDVISSAIAIGSPRLLVLAAQTFMQTDIIKTKKLITKALLNSPDASEFCGNYIGIHLEEQNSEVNSRSIDREYVDTETVVSLVCENNNGEEEKYCIHNENILVTSKNLY